MSFEKSFDIFITKRKKISVLISNVNTVQNGSFVD